MNRNIHNLKSYRLIKQLYIYAYLFEIYKSYQKHLENVAIASTLAAKEERINTESAEPE